MAKKKLTALKLMTPPPANTKGVGDVQTKFAKITKSHPHDPRFMRAFVDNKLYVLQSHPELSLSQRFSITQQLSTALKKKAGPQTSKTLPVPGGVGDGIFYTESFKTNFDTGTSLVWQAIAPLSLGGNVATWLYVTATNRSAKGVEAFIAYDAQGQAFFKVFDWARSDSWQTNIPLSQLSEYFTFTSAHGMPYPTLTIMNTTFINDNSSWVNQVWLKDKADKWQLVYEFSYATTNAEQKTGWVGSWGPIVETFQNLYQGTAAIGALGTQLVSRDATGRWGEWHFLAESDSSIRSDNVGFQRLFLDSNYSWAVSS